MELQAKDELEKCTILDKAKWNFLVALKHYLIPGGGGMYRLHLEKYTFVSIESGVMFVDNRK